MRYLVYAFCLIVCLLFSTVVAAQETPTPAPTPVLSGETITLALTGETARFDVTYPEEWRATVDDANTVTLRFGYSPITLNPATGYSEQSLPPGAARLTINANNFQPSDAPLPLTNILSLVLTSGNTEFAGLTTEDIEVFEVGGWQAASITVGADYPYRREIVIDLGSGNLGRATLYANTADFSYFAAAVEEIIASVAFTLPAATVTNTP